MGRKTFLQKTNPFSGASLHLALTKTGLFMRIKWAVSLLVVHEERDAGTNLTKPRGLQDQKKSFLTH